MALWRDTVTFVIAPEPTEAGRATVVARYPAHAAWPRVGILHQAHGGRGVRRRRSGVRRVARAWPIGEWNGALAP